MDNESHVDQNTMELIPKQETLVENKFMNEVAILTDLTGSMFTVTVQLSILTTSWAITTSILKLRKERTKEEEVVYQGGLTSSQTWCLLEQSLDSYLDHAFIIMLQLVNRASAGFCPACAHSSKVLWCLVLGKKK